MPRPRGYGCGVPIRLLLADDNIDMLNALKAVLSRDADIQVAGVAQGGAEAVRLVDELVPDVIVLDRAMPDIDGIDAMRKMKERHPDLPVVILTASAEPQVAESSLAAGASGYVVKDTAFEELAQAIRTVFAKKVYLSPRVGRRLFS
jgi:DNA-binding NarL/FixJ family response regulator